MKLWAFIRNMADLRSMPTGQNTFHRKIEDIDTEWETGLNVS
jgi:hypothetical protein